MVRFLRKRAVIIAAVLFLIPISGIVLAGPAHAQGGNQWCAGDVCFNAWNGGPSVRQYSPGVVNNDFVGIDDPNRPGTFQIQAVDAGGCIGDSGNNPGNATTGLVACWSGTSAGGWGSNFTYSTSGCPSGYFRLINQHWSGYVAPADGPEGAIGAEWYLNTNVLDCFGRFAAA